MTPRIFANAREMEDAALQAAAQGELVLTPTSRLSRRYRHAVRMRAVERKASASWPTPQVLTVDQWVKGLFESLWQLQAFMGKAQQLDLWGRAVEKVSGAGADALKEIGLAPGPRLSSHLQEAYDLLLKHGLADKGYSVAESELSKWRRKVVVQFEAMGRRAELVTAGQARSLVAGAISSKNLVIPSTIHTITTEDLLPQALSDFLSKLEGQSEIEVWKIEKRTVEHPPCRVMATPLQECQWACSEAVRVWNEDPRKDLAIVPLDESYFPMIEACLDELAGRRPLPDERHIRYNIAWGIPLTESPLFQAAVLPLRLGEADNPAAAIAELLLSPYAKPGKFEGFEGPEGFLGKKLWKEGAALPSNEVIALTVERFKASLAPLASLTPLERAPLKDWLDALEATWEGLKFFWREGQESTRDMSSVAEKQLRDAMGDLRAACGEIELDGKGILEWLTVFCENQRVTSRTGESAGIQVLPRSEAFGIPFDRVWVLGAHGESLPGSTPPQPLLSPAEFRLTLGGDREKWHWERAQCDLDGLLALVVDPEHLVISRAHERPDGKAAYIGSPLLSDGWKDSKNAQAWTFDIWGEQQPAWLAAPWLRGALTGSRTGDAIPMPDSGTDPGMSGLSPDATISATTLEKLIRCPFQHFASNVLNLRPMPEVSGGVSPANHGTIVHAILAQFAKRLASENKWPEDLPGAWHLLREVTAEQLAGKAGMAWEVERVRLLGTDISGTSGLLRKWLESEQKSATEGWRILAPKDDANPEWAFEGLNLDAGTGKVTVHGRADRIDGHPAEGRAIWDYKTGTPPDACSFRNTMSEPQIPIYLCALQAGLFDRDGDGRPQSFTQPLGGGFISVKSTAKNGVKRSQFLPDSGSNDRLPETTEDFLKRWRHFVKERLALPAGGAFPTDPLDPAVVPKEKSTTCKYCEFYAMCGQFDAQKADAGEDSRED